MDVLNNTTLATKLLNVHLRDTAVVFSIVKYGLNLEVKKLKLKNKVKFQIFLFAAHDMRTIFNNLRTFNDCCIFKNSFSF